MSYQTRTSGTRNNRHDPAVHGIFIHGGTCLMHGHRDPFNSNARPNDFGLSLPSMAGAPSDIFYLRPSFPSFSKAVDFAVAIRRDYPALHHSPIYACTDLIYDNPWSGSYRVQLVSPRLARRPSEAAMAAELAA